MIDDSRTAWQISREALDALAWSRLNHSAVLEPSVSRGQPFHGIPRLRLWDGATGFGGESGPKTLTVYELFGEGTLRLPVVRQAIWRRTPDIKRLSLVVEETGKPVLLEPTLSVCDADVPADRFTAFVREGSLTHVNVAWLRDNGTVTCDAGTRGYEFFSRDQPPAVLKLEWSHDTPFDWYSVKDWFGRLWNFLEECFHMGGAGALESHQ